MKSYLLQVWHDAAYTNNQRLISYLSTVSPHPKILDLGSYHPDLVKIRFAHLVSPKIYTVDQNPQVVKVCRQAGYASMVANVEKKLPFPSKSFDIVTANQIIEHLLDVDQFMTEISRVLKPGGQLIISTENLSSWHNIFALTMGWQAFSQHLSTKRNIGNPLRLPDPTNVDPLGMHIKIFTPFGLSELLRLYKFTNLQVFGGGYAFFPNPLASFLSYLDPTHSTFIGISATKKS